MNKTNYSVWFVVVLVWTIPGFFVAGFGQAAGTIWIPSGDQVFPDRSFRTPRISRSTRGGLAPHELAASDQIGEFRLRRRIVHPAERERVLTDLGTGSQQVALEVNRPISGEVHIRGVIPEDRSDTEAYRRTVHDTTQVRFPELSVADLQGSVSEVRLHLYLRTNWVEVYWEPTGVMELAKVDLSVEGTRKEAGKLWFVASVPSSDHTLGKLVGQVSEQTESRQNESGAQQLRIEYLEGIEKGRKMNEIGYWLRPMDELGD